MLDDMKVKAELPFKPKILEKRVSPTKKDQERFKRYDMKYTETIENLLEDDKEIVIDPYQKELIMHQASKSEAHR